LEVAYKIGDDNMVNFALKILGKSYKEVGFGLKIFFVIKINVFFFFKANQLG
jgi:hypothetical protein